MSKRCELQKEYYQRFGNYKGEGKYSEDYVRWLEDEVVALRDAPSAQKALLKNMEKSLNDALLKETPENLMKIFANHKNKAQ
jgi:hypothetical protein